PGHPPPAAIPRYLGGHRRERVGCRRRDRHPAACSLVRAIMSFATTADDAGPPFGRRLLELAPGIALLLAIGYGGKLIEQPIAAYGKANHLALPNIEYVLWAIVIGLIIANTVGVPKIFRAGVATYEFWLKLGIVL